jgi:predicted Zn finger-like uncharacterized protein
MKFSCDDCGAQYMIADDKIGPRGVKVRCKKCANVIVLRTGPDGVPVQGTATIPPPGAGSGASAAASGSAASSGSSSGAYPKASVSSIPQAAPSPLPVPEALKPRKTAQPPPPPDSEEDEATVALDTRGRGPSLLGELPLGVSSDLGLSQEFAARGFDPAPPPAEPRSDVRSPFSGVSMGGSLRDLASEERTPTPPPLASPTASPLSLGAVGLGAVVPDDDNTGEVNTSVDHLPSVAAATPRVLSRDDDDDESSALGDLSGAAGRADSVVPAPGEFDEVATRVAKPSPDDLERSLDVALPTPFAKPQASAHLDGRRDEATVTHGRSLGDDDDAQDGGLAADLDRSLGEDDLPLPMAAKASASGSGRPRATGIDGLQATNGNLDDEIGSAFEAVFGAQSGRLEDPFAALGGPNGAHEPGGEDDRKATRVFDTDAMRKLQDEQDLAVGLDLGDSAPPPAPSVTAEATREWYVAVNDEQVGPLSIPEVQARWSKGDVDATSLCWKQGMADWIAIRFVRELESVLMSSDATSARVTKADLADEPPTRAHVVAARAKESSAIVPPSSQPIIAQVRPGSVAAAAQALAQESTLDMRRKSTLVDVPGSPPEATEPSEPSWRPSAASALASLAQAELETSSAKLAAARDVAVGPALPAKGAYEPLSASMFGAGEQTSTRAGGLPKSADLGSSVSLRDPAPARPKGGISVPVAVLGGAVILAVAVVAAVLLTRADPPLPVAVAPVATPAASMAAAPVATPAATTALAPAPAPDPAVTPPPAAPGAEGAAAAPAAGAAPAASASPAGLPEGAVASAAPVASAAGRPLAAGGREPRASRRPTPTKDREPAARAAPAAKDPEPDALEVAAAPRKSSERVEADDLLAEGDRAGSKPAPRAAAAAAEAAAEDVPEQLEETDILRVLRKYKADINACKEKQAKDDPGLEGVMTVNLVVLKTGRTSQPTVAPDKFKSSSVGKCVVNSVKGWKFPQFSGRPMPIDFPVPVRGRG